MVSEPQRSKPCEANCPRRIAVRRNLEGTQQEKLQALKASRSAHHGVINRVKVEKLLVDKTFFKCSKCCDDVKEVLSPEEEVKYREVV